MGRSGETEWRWRLDVRIGASVVGTSAVPCRKTTPRVLLCSYCHRWLEHTRIHFVRVDFTRGRTDVWYNWSMEAFAIPDATRRVCDDGGRRTRRRVHRRVLDTRARRRLIDIRRAIDRLEAEFLRRLDRFDRAHGAAGRRRGEHRVLGARALRHDREGGRDTASIWRGRWASSRPRSTAPVPVAPPSAT